MPNQRLTRVNELLKREIAAFMYRLISEVDFDIAAVTVTHVVTAPNLRHAKVFVSIRDHILDREEMLDTISQHRMAIQRHINETLHLKYTPHLEFKLDESIEKGDRVLHLIAELEEEYGTPPPDESTDPESEPDEPESTPFPPDRSV